MVNSMSEQNEEPDTGAVYTFGRSRFAGNLRGVFWIRNDPVLQVACGDEHSAVITASGRVFSFGSNEWGQLGLGHANAVSKPTLVKGLQHERVTLVACGRSHTIVATDSGTIYSFGANGEGQLGLSQVNEFCLEPRAVEKFSSKGIKSLSAGAEHSLALTDNGQIFVWGSNSEGQLGLPEKAQCPVPTELKLETSGICVSAGYYHSAVVTDDGKLYTFGESESGKLGLPEHLRRRANRPQQVSGITGKITWVACGGSHTLTLTADGRVFSFGDGSSGQLGLGTQFLQSSSPERVILPKNCRIARVSCGENHTALLADTGQLYMCGDGRHGKLGTENLDACANQFLALPVKQFNDYQVQQVSCGGLHTLVLAVKRPPPCENGNTVVASIEHHPRETKPSARERRRKHLKKKSKVVAPETLENGMNLTSNIDKAVANGENNIPLCSSDEEEEGTKENDEVQSISLSSTLARKRGSILEEAEKDESIRHVDSDVEFPNNTETAAVNRNLEEKEKSIPRETHLRKAADEDEIVTESLQIVDEIPEEYQDAQKQSAVDNRDSLGKSESRPKGTFRFSSLFGRNRKTDQREHLSSELKELGSPGSSKEQLDQQRATMKDTKGSEQSNDKQSKTCTLL